MVKLNVDPQLKTKLNGLSEVIDICDDAGGTIGRFLPTRVYKDICCAAMAAETPFSKDEMKRLLNQPREGKPLAEIWKSLGRTQ